MQDQSALKRIKAVKEVIGGKPLLDVSRKYGCTRQSLYLWLKKYKKDPKSAHVTLKNSYKRGRKHYKTLHWNIEKKVLDFVIKEPQLSIRSLKAKLGEIGIKVSEHGVYNILIRYQLQTEELRHRFSLNHPLKTLFAGSIAPAYRAKVIEEHLKEGKNVSQICRAWKISRVTFYAWLNRYKKAAAAQGEESSIIKALARNYKKGWEHHRSLGESARDMVRGIVIGNPGYSVHKIYASVPKVDGKPVVGHHGIQNILAREDLNTYEKRLRFAQGYSKQPEVQVAPLYIPQIPLYKLRHLIAHFATVPKLLITNPKKGLPSVIVAISSSLIFILWIRLLATTPGQSPVGLFFASIALFFGLFFFIYSMKYYISTLMVLKLAQSGAKGPAPISTDQKPISADSNINDQRSTVVQNILRAIPFIGRVEKFLGSSRLRSNNNQSRVNPLLINLEKVELNPGERPFVSIHVAIYNERRVVERLIRACEAQEWSEEVSQVSKVSEVTKATDESSSSLAYRQAGNRGSDSHFRENDTRGGNDIELGAANYEVIIADDSTDETYEIAKQLLSSEGRILDRILFNEEMEIYVSSPPVGSSLPVIKLIHRFSRSGFKGGALQKALENTNPKAAYITIFDADFVPYPDTIEQFVKTFQVLNANDNANVGRINANEQAGIGINSHNSNSSTNSHSNIAAVQGYQWHVLNKSQNWVTRGVRTEYAGSYVVERAGEEIYGGLKQIAGSVYMIRAEILRQFGWGTSITEDFELTLRLYERGYKVAFTPYIQAPAEAVSTLKRLIRQRMRWAEGASFNIKVMLGRMLWGRWEDRFSVFGSQFSDYGQSVSQSAGQLTDKPTTDQQLSDNRQPRTDNRKVWVPSRLTRAEKLEFAYLAPYYLQAAFFVIGTFSWFISETIIGTRLPFWTAALGWSLVFTNLLALPLMNIVGMFLEESDERDYIGIVSFIALSYIVVPFQAYAAIKGFLETEEGPWFRTPKTGLITDTLGRSGFSKFFGNILGRPAAVHANAMRMESARMNANFVPVFTSAGANELEDDNLFRMPAIGNWFGGSMPALVPIKAFRPLRRVSRRLVSRSFMAIVVIFTMVINYMAIMGSNLAQLPSQEDVAAEESGPTKLGESNLALARPQEFAANIEKIEVEKSVNLSGEIDFQYQAYLDDDNLAMFGRYYANGDANDKRIDANERIDKGVVRIVYAGGKYMQMEIPGIIGGPTAMSSSISFEQEAGLIDFKILASSLAWEYTYFKKPATNHLTIDLLMSEDLVPRRANAKGWQIIDESAKSTIFFLKNPEVKGVDGTKGKVTMDITNSYLVSLLINQTFLDSASYPISTASGIETNPPYPVFDIADARKNEASDYNYVVTVPGNRNKVGFNSKSGNSVGYRIDTGDNLYNMELAMKERSAVPTSVNGGKVSYDLGNMEAVYEVWNDRVKADYILKSKPAKNTIDFTLNNFSQIPTKNINCGSTSEESKPTSEVFGENVRCVGPEEAEKAGSISFFGDDGYGNINGREVFRLDIPSIKDGNGNEIPRDKASLSFSKEPPPGCVPGDSSTSPRGCFGLVPEKLVPKYCIAEDKDCLEPQGYYNRSGIITLTIDQGLLDSVVYPLTIDPTSIDTAVGSTATAYGSQRHLLNTSDNDLVAFYVDSDSDIEAYYSNNNGQSWSNLANVYVGTVDNFGAAIDSSNNVSISFDESSNVKYLKITNMITSNDIDGTWTVSSPVILDDGTSTTPNKAGTPNRPSSVIDKNVFPAVSWSFETSGGTKASSIRFSRANADPTTKTNWKCATNSSCGYVKLTDCSTDVCGDIIISAVNVNIATHSAIAKAPSTADKPDELVIVYLWNSTFDLVGNSALVSGADYGGWTSGFMSVTTADTANQDLSVLAVDDGTNQRIWVGWDDTVDPQIRLGYLDVDNNSWTESPTGSPAMTGDSPSLAYDAQEEDIYVWDNDKSADTLVEFRKYDINGAAWDSADQLFDIPLSAEDLIYPSLKQDNAPTTSPGPKLDLVYMNNDNAMTPVYTVFYHTWHTKETRNHDIPVSLPTSEALTITSNNSDKLAAFYDEGDYTDSNSDNSVFVPTTNNVISDNVYFVHTFKKTHSNDSDTEIQISWNGRVFSSVEGCIAARPCTLQIYQWGKTGCTAGWGDFDTGTRTDTTTASNTQFTLTGNRTTNTSCYYSGTGDQDDHLGANTVSVRVYKQVVTSAPLNLQTDVITFAFVPEKVLLLLPLALFMPRIMRRFGWNVRFRKRFKFMDVRRR